ncbi:MAG: hypothetical protein U5L09_00315 [Bacteroidales bacterium]|nr:hypothetical protein [Bacteroidales bacterium]
MQADTSHIYGGAFWGFLYANNLRKGKEMATFFDRIKWPRLRFSGKRKKKHHFENVYVNKKPMTDEEYNARKLKHQKRMDEILDKIFALRISKPYQRKRKRSYSETVNDKEDSA